MTSPVTPPSTPSTPPVPRRRTPVGPLPPLVFSAPDGPALCLACGHPQAMHPPDYDADQSACASCTNCDGWEAP